MYLLEVELLREFAEQHLREERSIEIQEFVRLPVLVQVRLFGKIFLGGHARRSVNRRSSGKVVDLDAMRLQLHVALCRRRQGDDLIGVGGIDNGLQNRISGEESNEAFVQNLVGGFTVGMRRLVFQNILHVLARVLEQQVASAGMIFDEIRHIENSFPNCHIARLLIVVLLNFGERDRRKGSGRHGAGRGGSAPVLLEVRDTESN